jgi:hypothetical protein
MQEGRTQTGWIMFLARDSQLQVFSRAHACSHCSFHFFFFFLAARGSLASTVARLHRFISARHLMGWPSSSLSIINQATTTIHRDQLALLAWSRTCMHACFTGNNYVLITNRTIKTSLPSIHIKQGC